MTQGSTFDWRALVFRTRYPTAVAFGLAERDRLTALKRTAFGYATINGFGKRSVLLYLGATPVVREFRELHNRKEIIGNLQVCPKGLADNLDYEDRATVCRSPPYDASGCRSTCRTEQHSDHAQRKRSQC